MKILPPEEFCLLTSLPLPEAVKLIAVTRERNTNSANTAGPDDGLEDTIFQIQPAVTYRSSFLPVITGRGKSVESGSQIKIAMTLPVVPYAFFGALVCWGVIEGFVLINDASALTIGALLPIVVSIPLLTIIIGSFKFEVFRNRRFLIKRLNAIVLE